MSAPRAGDLIYPTALGAQGWSHYHRKVTGTQWIDPSSLASTRAAGRRGRPGGGGRRGPVHRRRLGRGRRRSRMHRDRPWGRGRRRSRMHRDRPWRRRGPICRDRSWGRRRPGRRRLPGGRGSRPMKRYAAPMAQRMFPIPRLAVPVMRLTPAAPVAIEVGVPYPVIPRRHRTYVIRRYDENGARDAGLPDC